VAVGSEVPEVVGVGADAGFLTVTFSVTDPLRALPT
jgi:hypothetical protein